MYTYGQFGADRITSELHECERIEGMMKDETSLNHQPIFHCT
jgi:hypothetical protein